MHRKGFILINNIPTPVETWGRWVEEAPTKENEDIIILIPGNPGVLGYYRKFLETIHKQLKCPVWTIGHAGHQKLEVEVPTLEGNEKLYDLQAQIDFKINFFETYVQDDARVHLIGHSIGAYICLNLLNVSNIKRKVRKNYLLFPTLENIGQTPNGKFLLTIIKHITWIIIFLAFIFTLLPNSLQTLLLYGFCKIRGIPNRKVNVTKELIHPEVLDKIFYMAFDEMKLMKDLEPNLIEPNLKYLKFYYGASDKWAPVSHYRNLMEKYLEAEAEVCTRNFDHAFVLKSSIDMANLITTWIQLEN